MLKQTEAGYVDHYQDYVDDFGTFMNEVVLKDAPAEVHVLGHSMGGLIASIYSIQHPGVIRSMALSAPMYEPNLGKYSECMALTIAGFMKLIGRETDIAPGRSLDEWKNPFDGNHVTHSAARYGYAQEFLYAHPDEAIGGPTYRWVQEAILGGRWVRKHAESFLTPVRILQDEDEEVVVSSFENQVCKKAKSCEIQVIDGAKHEMLMESDAQRNRAISLALDWFGKHSSAHQSE
jgi:lysophospholipase